MEFTPCSYSEDLVALVVPLLALAFLGESDRMEGVFCRDEMSRFTWRWRVRCTSAYKSQLSLVKLLANDGGLLCDCSDEVMLCCRPNAVLTKVVERRFTPAYKSRQLLLERLNNDGGSLCACSDEAMLCCRPRLGEGVKAVFTKVANRRSTSVYKSQLPLDKRLSKDGGSLCDCSDEAMLCCRLNAVLTKLVERRFTSADKRLANDGGLVCDCLDEGKRLANDGGSLCDCLEEGMLCCRLNAVLTKLVERRFTSADKRLANDGGLVCDCLDEGKRLAKAGGSLCDCLDEGMLCYREHLRKANTVFAKVVNDFL